MRSPLWGGTGRPHRGKLRRRMWFEKIVQRVEEMSGTGADDGRRRGWGRASRLEYPHMNFFRRTGRAQAQASTAKICVGMIFLLAWT